MQERTCKTTETRWGWKVPQATMLQNEAKKKANEDQTTFDAKMCHATNVYV